MPIQKLNLASPDLAQDKLAQVRAVVPEAFNLDGSLNPDKLQEALSGVCEVEKERFGLNWVGKQEAMRLAGKPTTATLRPMAGESVDFDTTQNAIIEGDNLEVLKVLQRSYHGKIKMIYIDPPYNTGSDFVYKDDRSEREDAYLRRADLVDDIGRMFVSNTRTDGRFHSNWLSMMASRLMLARNLMRDDGVIFISIDDNEIAHLRLLMDEIFGEENFFSEMVWKNKTGGGAKTKGWIGLHEYIICYAKNIESIQDVSIPYSEKTASMYNKRDENFSVRGPYATWPLDTTSMGDRPNLRFPIAHEGQEIWPEKQWLWSKERVGQAIKEGILEFNKQRDGTYKVRFKGYLKDENGVTRRGKPLSIFDGPYTQEGSGDFQEFFSKDVFAFPKPIELLRQLLAISTADGQDSDSLILDFFAGSGTTAHAVMAQNALDNGNRKFILVQLPEPTPEDSPAKKAGFPTIAHITRERVRRAGKKLAAPGSAEHQLGKNKASALFDESIAPKAELGLGAPRDLGFRAFTLDTSNFSAWNPAATTMAQLELQVKSHADSTVPGRTEQDLLFEILVKAGFAPTEPVESFAVSGARCFAVRERQWVLCLEAQVALETLEAIAALTPAPTRVVCLDGALADDAAKANAAAFYRQKGIELRVV